MSIVLLKSNNPQFSHIISKNPETGMIAKKVRKGTAFGWYGESDVYSVLFQDAPNEVSYTKNEDTDFEYNDLTRYNSPVFVLNAVTTFFKSAYAKPHTDDVEGFKNEFIMHVSIERLNLIKNMFYRLEDAQITYELMAGDTYKITIFTQKPIFYLLSVVNVFALMTSITNGNYLGLTNELLTKYVTALNNIGATYYMKYLFNLKAIVSNKLFLGVKEQLEQDTNHVLELKYGNTAEWRRDFVFSNLSFNHDVMDLGCGEGFYTLPLAKKLPDNQIFAIDIDEECINTVNGKAESRQLTNIITADSLESYKTLHYDEENKLDILMVEVVEHMEMHQAKDLLKEVLKLNFNRIYVTSPTQEFNVHYDLDNSFGKNTVRNGFRHDDHKWEGTVEEFTELVTSAVNEVLGTDDVKLTHHMIGDKVDGIAPTQAFIIEKV